MQYFDIGDCTKMIMKIAKIEFQTTNQSFEFSANTYCPNVSTAPIIAIGWRQCLPLSIVQLKGKHYQKPIAVGL